MAGRFVWDDGVDAEVEKCLERRATRSAGRAMPGDDEEDKEECDCRAEAEAEEEEEEGEGNSEERGGGREVSVLVVGGARVGKRSKRQRAVGRKRAKGAPGELANWVRRRHAADVAAGDMGGSVAVVWFGSGPV
jgi:hypothetical protein